MAGVFRSEKHYGKKPEARTGHIQWCVPHSRRAPYTLYMQIHGMIELLPQFSHNILSVVSQEKVYVSGVKKVKTGQCPNVPQRPPLSGTKRDWLLKLRPESLCQLPPAA